jgi:hypothetical protein
MYFMNLNILSDFMQFLNNTRKHSTKNEYFTMPVILTIIYLLREQKLNPNKYSEQKINTIYFRQANEYYMIMHANIQYDKMHRFL